MSNNRDLRKSSLFQQVTLEVVLNLLERSLGSRRLWANNITLAKDHKKPAKRRAVAANRLSMPLQESLKLLNGALIHSTDIKVFTVKPATEIAHDAKAARATLVAVSFAEKPCSVTIDVNTQRALIQTST